MAGLTTADAIEAFWLLEYTRVSFLVRKSDRCAFWQNNPRHMRMMIKYCEPDIDIDALAEASKTFRGHLHTVMGMFTIVPNKPNPFE